MLGRRLDALKRAVIPRRLRRRRAAEPPTGAAVLAETLIGSYARRFAEQPELERALVAGEAPLGAHEAAFQFISALSRDVSHGIAHSVEQSVRAGRLAGVFDALGAVAAHQFLLAPYYFAFGHQNRERRDLARITGFRRDVNAAGLKLGLFTDTFDEVNGVGRFVRDLAEQASRQGRQLVVHTCCERPASSPSYRKNFEPLLSRPLPGYRDLNFVVPPLAEVMEWADRQQFDAVYVDTPGPMGLIGLLVARMLRVPVLGTWHTNFPAYVDAFTGDYRLSSLTRLTASGSTGGSPPPSAARVNRRTRSWGNSASRPIGWRSRRRGWTTPCSTRGTATRTSGGLTALASRTG